MTWREEFAQRKHYTTNEREPFYWLAARFLPADPAAPIVDIGAGHGEFLPHIPAERHPATHLLEGNPESCRRLQAIAARCRIALYRAPGQLPFADSSVGFIHCSHLVEHLSPADLYTMLREMDRVLQPGGRLTISAPLLSPTFYNDFSHLKPYNPSVFQNYLGGTPERQSTNQAIAHGYRTRCLVYRYTSAELWQTVGSPWWPVDFTCQVLKRALYRLGLRAYTKNGFTLVLEKRVE